MGYSYHFNVTTQFPDTRELAGIMLDHLYIIHICLYFPWNKLILKRVLFATNNTLVSLFNIIDLFLSSSVK